METEDLKEKKDLRDKVEDMAGHVGDYVNTYYRLTVLKAAQKATNIGAGMFAGIVAVALGLFVVLFTSIALAWWLGDLVGSRAGGFLLVAGLYLVIMVALIAMRKKIIFPFVRNLIIRKIYE